MTERTGTGKKRAGNAQGMHGKTDTEGRGGTV